MAKKKTGKRTTKADRAHIIATANAKGWTADQVAKRFGVSKWTYYGWRKRAGATKTRGRRPGRPAKGTTTGITTAALRDEIRAVLPGILREEIARVLIGMVGKRTTRRRRRGGKK